MGSPWIVFVNLCFCFIPSVVRARKAACHNPIYGTCFGIKHNCPAACPRFCEVDCRLCKPYCACDKPGAVCQDPRFVGGDGIMFYFHGRKNKDFCLVSDSEIHINAHFIGKRSKKGRDFTWVQSIGILFGGHRFYLGARTVAKWQESTENMLIKLNGEDIAIPNVEGKTWQSPETGLKVLRLADTNKVKVKVEGLFEIAVRVVPITSEESRVHGYDITAEDCFAHLELYFKFESISKMVDRVLGQTYRPTYQSRVKMAAPMPVMGGVEKFASSHLFATDCVVSKFRLETEEDGAPLRVACGSSYGGKGILCKR
ncbi:BMP-binding endothelial regulator protein [Actinidia chinensis var. chinensis]|uniref:BMP-binding endothelial regulator protein n=1 Tax=Actinidia chinensis var. chinensis TaxID=1590841 RepID=A0A2R6RMF3_ACTCC|nr:BMP-binding endothelial regulator protein [Actinidia chinensis var. chinensis]